MRRINIVMDDKGRTEVEILPDPENGRFFTKRDFDNALRALKKAYRTSIKEFRKKKLKIKSVKEQKDETECKQNSRENRDGKETGNESERKEPGVDSSRTENPSLAGAVEQALSRPRKLSFGKRNGEDSAGNGSS